MARRVLFVVDGLAGGGAERILLRLAGHIAGLGHTVALANLRDQVDLEPPAGVEIIPAFDTSPRRLRKVGEIRRRALLLDRHLEARGEWDLVISTLPHTDRIVARSSLAERVWYRVANPLSEEQLKNRRGLKKLRRLRRLRRTYDGRKVIAISGGVGADLVNDVGIRPSRLETIHNPFDVAEIRRLASAPCPLAGTDYLVHVGRFDAQKRHDRLLGAFARSTYAGRLVLVGTGTEEEQRRVREWIAAHDLESRVELTGFQPNPYPYIKHARALVLSSDFEGFGSVLVEALICGTPVVSTRCPSGPEEILTGNLAAGLADLTEESLAEAMDRVLARPPGIGPASHERFEIDSIARRYLELAD